MQLPNSHAPQDTENERDREAHDSWCRVIVEDLSYYKYFSHYWNYKENGCTGHYLQVAGAKGRMNFVTSVSRYIFNLHLPNGDLT